MQQLRIEISKELYDLLVDSNALTTSNHKLLLVEDKDFDYTNDEIWKAYKKKSDKCYKDLKEVEFRIRHNMPHE